MASTLGAIAIPLTLNGGLFNRSADAVTRRFTKLAVDMRRKSKTIDLGLSAVYSTMRGIGTAARVAGRLGVVGLGAIAGATAGAVAGLQQVSEKFRDIKKRSDEFGLSTRQIQLLDLSAAELNANADKIADFYKDAMEKIGIAINEGTGEGFQALKLLGLDPTAFQSVEEAIDPILERLVKLPEASRRAIQGMFAGAGADLPSEHLGILREIIINQERVAATFKGLFADDETVQRGLRAGNALERIGKVVTALKTRVLTSEWLTNLVDFAESFALGLSRMGDRVAFKELFDALKSDFKTLAIYVKDVFVWAFTEVFKQVPFMLRDAIVMGVNNAIQNIPGGSKLLGLALASQPGVMQRPGAAAPFPTAGAFKTPGAISPITEVGEAVKQGIKDAAKDMTLSVNQTGAQSGVAGFYPFLNTMKDALKPGGTSLMPDIKGTPFVDQMRKFAKMNDDAFKKRLEETQRLAAEKFRVIHDNLAYAIETGFSQGAKAGLKMLFNIVQHNLMRNLGNQISGAILNIGGIGQKMAGAKGGFLGGLGSLLGFANGGSFMVGGGSGVDKNLVSFKASKGERVDVLTPAQQIEQMKTMMGAMFGGSFTYAPQVLTREGMEEAALAAVERNPGMVAGTVAPQMQSMLTTQYGIR